MKSVRKKSIRKTPNKSSRRKNKIIRKSKSKKKSIRRKSKVIRKSTKKSIKKSTRKNIPKNTKLYKKIIEEAKKYIKNGHRHTQARGL